MIRHCCYILLAVIALTGCSHPKSFTLEGEVAALGTQGLRLTWRTASGRVLSGEATAVDSRFTFTGSAPDTTLVEIYSSAGARLGSVPVVNGSKVRFTLDDSRPRRQLTVSGKDDMARRWAGVVNGLPSEPDAANAAVAAYVGANPASPLSAMLLGSEYTPRGHEAEADSLAALLTRRPAWLLDVAPGREVPRLVKLHLRTDSAHYYSSAGVWVFTADETERTPELMDSLRLWSERADSATHVHDVWLGADLRYWEVYVQADSLKWTQAIAPDGPAGSALQQWGIPSTPYYIEIDTLSQIVKRFPL